jgi:NAD+ synthase
MSASARRALRVAIHQKNPIAGDIEGNRDVILAAIWASALSSRQPVDLLVFPEAFLSGYPIDDLAASPPFLRDIEKAVQAIADEVQARGGPAVLFGAPEEGADRPFNSAYLILPDGSKKVARKVDLPNEGPFDERRVFAAGDERLPFEVAGFRIGVVICEEMWHPHIPARLASGLADVLIVINGSPYTRGKAVGDRLGHARRRVRETGVPLIYCNMVGGQDELVFDGASFVLDSAGRTIMQMESFAEAVETVEVEHGEGGGVASHDFADAPPRMRPLATVPTGSEADYRACVLALRDYVGKQGFRSVIVGISGGVDSALVAAMAVDALGPDRVRGVTMPSRVTSSDSLGDAHAVGRTLGITLDETGIADMVEASSRALAPILGEAPTGVTLENLQARSRMMVLMALSNATGALVLTTGNKSECSVGYATLFGDMAGGFNPIKDLYKTEVWELSRWRNRSTVNGLLGPKEPIPESVIAKPPTAELAEGQTDEATLGPYALLDALLRGIVDTQVGPEEALRRVDLALPGSALAFLTPEHARRIARMTANAEYKRRMAAPGPKIGPRAFGRDRRYPIVNRFNR